VLLIRAIHVVVRPAEKVLQVSGLVRAFVAIALILFFARDLFGSAAGVLAAALLASDPAFWFAGVTNQNRLFLAAGALGVAWLAWRALMRPSDPRWLYSAFAALGIAAGFRPQLGVLLLPQLASVWWTTSRSLRRLAIALAMLVGLALPWLAVVMWVVGGSREFLQMCASYTDDQFGGSSFCSALPSARLGTCSLAPRRGRSSALSRGSGPFPSPRNASFQSIHARPCCSLLPHFCRRLFSPRPSCSFSWAALSGNDFNGIRYDVNQTTGEATNSRPTGISNLAELLFNSSSVLYGIFMQAQIESLYRINPVTGASTLIGTSSVSNMFTDSLVEGDLRFDPVSGTLFGVEYQSVPFSTPVPKGFTINPATAAFPTFQLALLQ
jgi:hypothetical protein